MELKRTSSITDDPLAGCLEIVESWGNFKNLLMTLQSFLGLFIKDANAKLIVDKIWDEGSVIEPMTINEYVINEVQYEIRRAKKGGRYGFADEFEEAVYKSWIKKIIRRFGEDKALEFVSKLKQNREKRHLTS